VGANPKSKIENPKSKVESNELTTTQAERIRDALLPHVRYLYKLKTRMEKTGFPPGDRLFRLTGAAYDSAQQLAMALHYLSCESGVGKPPPSGLSERDSQ
jgi:hypothetical protein